MNVLIFQEDSTTINVGNHWPSVVASGALLLVTDALSGERTVGSYILSSCDLSASQIAEFLRLRGAAEALMALATTYDVNAAQLLKQHIFDTSIQHNVTELRRMIQAERFVETCNNMTSNERNELTLEWGHSTEVYILTIDELREKYIIPFILQVNSFIIGEPFA